MALGKKKLGRFFLESIPPRDPAPSCLSPRRSKKPEHPHRKDPNRGVPSGHRTDPATTMMGTMATTYHLTSPPDLEVVRDLDPVMAELIDAWSAVKQAANQAAGRYEQARIGMITTGDYLPSEVDQAGQDYRRSVPPAVAARQQVIDRATTSFLATAQTRRDQIQADLEGVALGALAARVGPVEKQMIVAQLRHRSTSEWRPLYRVSWWASDPTSSRGAPSPEFPASVAELVRRIEGREPDWTMPVEIPVLSTGGSDYESPLLPYLTGHQRDRTAEADRLVGLEPGSKPRSQRRVGFP